MSDDSFTTFSLKAKGPDALDLSQMINNDLASTVKKYPERFVALGTVPMQDPELAVRELIRCKEELGIAGFSAPDIDYTYDCNNCLSYYRATAK